MLVHYTPTSDHPYTTLTCSDSGTSRRNVNSFELVNLHTHTVPLASRQSEYTLNWARITGKTPSIALSWEI